MGRPDGLAAESTAAARPVAAAAVPAAKVGTVNVEQLFALKESGELLLIDVRPSFFFHSGHIGGAVNLPARKVDEWLPGEQARLEAAGKAGRPVVLYCTNLKCPDAKRVAGALAQRGIPCQVYPGGWEEWQAAGVEG